MSDSDSIEANDNSSSEDVEAEEAATNNDREGISNYEKQRLSRIAENRARLEALGLRKMASSFKHVVHNADVNVTHKKGKRKVGDDEEYVPDDLEARLSSSSEEDEHDDEDFVGQKASRSRKRKVGCENVRNSCHLCNCVHLPNSY